MTHTDTPTDGRRDTELDVVDVLTADHHEVSALIQRIWAETDPAARRDLADVMISELVRHSVAEETFVYPAMILHLPGGAQSVEHDTQEHKDLERTMKSLEAAEPDGEHFEELLRHLETVLNDHVTDEENEQFPRLRAHIPRAELLTLAGQVEAIKMIAPTRPHPAQPNNGLVHALVGPGLGMVDRLRDRISGRPTA